MMALGIGSRLRTPRTTEPTDNPYRKLSADNQPQRTLTCVAPAKLQDYFVAGGDVPVSMYPRWVRRYQLGLIQRKRSTSLLAWVLKEKEPVLAKGGVSLKQVTEEIVRFSMATTSDPKSSSALQSSAWFAYRGEDNRS